MRGGYMFGYTGNYIKVRAPYDRSRINTFSRVELLGMEGDTMEAAILG